MSRYRDALPQLGGDLFLADAGLETDLIFNHGIEIPEFAAHTLLPDARTRQAVADYFRPFLELAKLSGTGFVLDSQTWKAHIHWAEDLGASTEELRAANEDSIAFIAQLRDEFPGNPKPIVLNGIIGPMGDGYVSESEISADRAEQYHAQQLGWLAATPVDMVTATTFTRSREAAGLALSARALGLPVVVSFTVETDGSLPSGRPLGEAIQLVDEESGSAPAYFTVNCAHPDHFFHVFEVEAEWTRRVRGVRCNASRLSHAELDSCEVLDDGDPSELGQRYRDLRQRMPWLNVFGGCCGTDLRHVTQIAQSLV